MFHKAKYGESKSQNHSNALNEEEIPDNEMNLLWHIDCEQTGDPLEGYQIQAELHVFEVLAEFGQAFKHKVLQDFLVNQDTNHIAIVVKGQIPLKDLTQRPECFLFPHDTEQSSTDKVHSLAVAYCRIADYTSIKHVSKRFDQGLQLRLV